MYFCPPASMLSHKKGKATRIVDEIALLTTLLQAYDAMENITLRQLSESSFSEGTLVYHVRHRDGSVRVARGYRRDRPVTELFRYFYPWATNDAVDWVATRAATLLCLEQQNYPAPQVVRTRSGALLSTTPAWCLLLTTFIEGAVLQPTLEQLRLLGASLGHLHTLNPEQIVVQSSIPGKSYWDTAQTFPTIQAHLKSVERQLPVEWELLHSEFVRVLQHLQQSSDLIQTLIHGDVWAANAVQISPDQVLLIDWETGGRGSALLDLGRFLLECHLDSNLPPDVPLAWHIQPAADRIAAVVAGYAQQRLPSPAELDILLDAIRFGIVFIGTLHFTQALQSETRSAAWQRGMERRLARLQNRWQVSAEIATLARERFASLCAAT